MTNNITEIISYDSGAYGTFYRVTMLLIRRSPRPKAQHVYRFKSGEAGDGGRSLCLQKKTQAC